MIHTVKGFSIVNEAEIDVFLELSCFFNDPANELVQIGKCVHQGCILSPCLFNLYSEYIILNARLDEAQAGIKIAGRNINNLRYVDDTTLMAESKRN